MKLNHKHVLDGSFEVGHPEHPDKPDKPDKPLPLQYAPLVGLSGGDLAARRSRKILDQIDACIPVKDSSVISVLSLTNAEFIERAAIAEYDGGLSRDEA